MCGLKPSALAKLSPSGTRRVTALRFENADSQSLLAISVLFHTSGSCFPFRSAKSYAIFLAASVGAGNLLLAADMKYSAKSASSSEENTRLVASFSVYGLYV